MTVSDSPAACLVWTTTGAADVVFPVVALLAGCDDGTAAGGLAAGAALCVSSVLGCGLGAYLLYTNWVIAMPMKTKTNMSSRRWSPPGSCVGFWYSAK